jgi:hypothetical protein
VLGGGAGVVADGNGSDGGGCDGSERDGCDGLSWATC